MPTTDVGGVQLYYEERGAGQPVGFVHGIPTDYRAWNNQVEEFSKVFRTFSYSRRYAWPNDREGDVSNSTIENNAADMKSLVEKLGLGPAHLVGHSYGGFTAAYLAAVAPNLVQSLTLVEPATATLLVKDETSSAQLLGLLLRSPSVALSARRFKNGSLGPSLRALSTGQTEKAVELNIDGIQDDRCAYDSMPEAARKMTLDNARTIAELATKFSSFKDKAPSVKSKTLVVNGGSSSPWPRKTGELTAAIPHSSRALVPNARHFPHMENPTEFNRRLRSFISADGSRS